jgi:glycosyltransferase involved in cell wall biosynthesis
VLALVTDAYGGTGGIAQYSRDMVEAIASHPQVADVTVLPRVISRDMQRIPDRVTHRTDSANSKLSFVKAVNSAARRGAFDLVVCGHINLLPLAYPAARKIGAPIVLLVYGVEVWEKKNPLIRELIKSCEGIVSISRLTRDRMISWTGLDSDRVFIIPNALDLDDFDERRARAPQHTMSGKPALLTLGRMEALEKGKGFDETLEVLPALIPEYPDIIYCAAGDGSDRSRLMVKARDLGVADHVVFPGYVSEEEKPALFAAADVYVMPGRLEGFGYAFLEALAAGTPVIGSILDGSGEAMKDGQWGQLVNPADRGALVAAIKAAIANPQVPPRSELEYFSVNEFRARTRVMLNSVLRMSQNEPVS